MTEYRIMLVDDEEEVRQAIIQKIDWQRLGYVVAGDAENGEDALEKMEQLEPDVVMTDIRMPYMDGLSLAGRLHLKYPSVKVLIFSGYDDFEYAQQAIKFNVKEYILKPVNVEELTEILSRVHNSLDEEIEQRRNISLLRESYQKSLPIIREVFLNELVSGNIEETVIRERLTEYEIDIQGADSWLTAVIDVEQKGTQIHTPVHKEKELIPILVRQMIAEQLSQYCRFAIFNAYSGLALIAAMDEDMTLTGLIDLLGDICKACRKVLEITVTIGVGHRTSRLSGLGNAYSSAVDALGYKAIVGTGNVIYINDVEPVSRGKLLLDSREEAALVTAVKFGPKARIEAAVDAIVHKLGDARVHIGQYKAYLLSVINCLTRLAQQYDLELKEYIGSGHDLYQEMIEALGRPEKLSDLIIQIGCRMNETMNRERDNAAKQVIVEAKKYIAEHYQEPGLSVEMICSHLHLSPAYFSTIFKKETGQAYIAYLTELRLQKAVELLTGTDDKTYVIAAKVGYQEQNYFSYVFKKRFGVSPTRFRRT